MLSPFLNQLAAGCLGMLALCRTDQVSWKYFRLIGRVALCLCAAALTLDLLDARGASMGRTFSLIAGFPSIALTGVLLGINAFQREPARPIQRLIAAAASIAALVAAFHASLPAQAGNAPRAAAELVGTMLIPPALACCGQIIGGAAAIGGATAAMLLGHAYLTHTSMPIDPLRRLAGAWAGVIALRWLWTAAVLMDGRAALQISGGDDLWLWLMLSVRAGVGLIGGAAMAYMAWDCVKRRSTQSATGILYIAMVLTFLGELSAAELGRTFGLWV